MLDDRNVDHEVERVIYGIIGLTLLGLMAFRLLRWTAGIAYYNETVWKVIAGRPMVHGRFGWERGFWELCPDGQLAAAAMIVIIVSLMLGAVLNLRRCYFVAWGVFVGGYAFNACLLLKLMGEY